MTHLQLAGLGGIFVPNDATEADVDRAIRRAELVRDLRQARAALAAASRHCNAAYLALDDFDHEGRAVR